MNDTKQKVCPLLKKNCIGLDCVWYTSIHSVTADGSTTECWDCAINWLPSLLVENSIHQRSTGASVETFRNEMVKANERTADVFKALLENNQNQNTLSIK